MKIKIKENALLARIAAKVLHSDRMAITMGHTIYLWHTSTLDFTDQARWVRHELKHVEQYLRYGRVWFLVLYLWESVLHGYRQNRFEIEARAAEEEDSYLEQYLGK